MTNPTLSDAELVDLGRRVLACTWIWGPAEGMVFWLGKQPGPTYTLAFLADAGNGLQEHDWIPKLDAPSTRGWLVEYVRRAWANHRVSPAFIEAVFSGQSEGWAVTWGDSRLSVDGTYDHPSELHALVAALEASREYAQRRREEGERQLALLQAVIKSDPDL